MTAEDKTGAPASPRAHNHRVVVAISLASLGLLAGFIHLSFPYHISPLQNRLDWGVVIIGLVSSVAAIRIGNRTRAKCRPADPGDRSHRWHAFICSTSVIAGVFGILLNLAQCMHNYGGANIAATRATLATVESALDKYHHDTGAYPTVERGLDELIHNSNQANWRGPYVRDGRMPLDAWGNSIRYRLVDGKPDLRSAGPDQIFDTSDDITL